MSRFIQICTTTASEHEAHQIADALVARRLAGCVQIDGPLRSVYRWQEKVEQAEEWRLTIKSSASLRAEVERLVCELHSYQCPELIATPIAAGSKAYLDWLGGQLGGC